MAQPVSVQAHVHRDAEAAALAAATQFIEVGQQAIERHGRFCAALAGGATPIRMYEMLAAAQERALDWGRVRVFFTDERCVRPDHPSSNYATVRRCLLDRVGVPEQQVHRIEGELAPYESAAERYDSMLRAFFCVNDEGLPREPTFDLVLLGIGEDGPTASLFPGSRALAEKRRWTVHARAPEGVESRDRITLTLPAINAARRGMFLVTGTKKSCVIRSLLGGVGDCGRPAAMIRCVGGVEWHLDKTAAGVVDTIQTPKLGS